MTEAEFKEAIHPLLARPPTAIAKLQFMAIWMDASEDIGPARLAVLARAVLYNDDRDQRTAKIVPFNTQRRTGNDEGRI